MVGDHRPAIAFVARPATAMLDFNRKDALPPAGELTVGGRQLRCHHGSFIDRGFPRRFVLIEEYVTMQTSFGSLT